MPKQETIDVCVLGQHLLAGRANTVSRIEINSQQRRRVVLGHGLQARSHFADIPPSSPSAALFKNGAVVDFLPRHRIGGRSAEDACADLTAMFDQHGTG